MQTSEACTRPWVQWSWATLRLRALWWIVSRCQCACDAEPALAYVMYVCMYAYVCVRACLRDFWGCVCKLLFVWVHVWHLCKCMISYSCMHDLHVNLVMCICVLYMNVYMHVTHIFHTKNKQTPEWKSGREPQTKIEHSCSHVFLRKHKNKQTWVKVVPGAWIHERIFGLKTFGSSLPKTPSSMRGRTNLRKPSRPGLSQPLRSCVFIHTYENMCECSGNFCYLTHAIYLCDIYDIHVAYSTHGMQAYPRTETDSTAKVCLTICAYYDNVSSVWRRILYDKFMWYAYVTHTWRGLPRPEPPCRELCWTPWGILSHRKETKSLNNQSQYQLNRQSEH